MKFRGQTIKKHIVIEESASADIKKKKKIIDRQGKITRKQSQNACQQHVDLQDCQ